MKRFFLLILIFFVWFLGCNKEPESKEIQWSSADSARFVEDILSYRHDLIDFLKNHPESPFNKDTSIRYEGVKWFPPDIHFTYKSKLYKNPIIERAIIMGTKGEERHFYKYGYFLIPRDGKQIHLNVYKEERASGNQLSLWFTDETTGKETYEVGRYVEIGEEENDPEHEYFIDFNKAYNPYCSYSHIYTCPIPPKENRLPFAVKAGEMKFLNDHN